MEEVFAAEVELDAANLRRRTKCGSMQRMSDQPGQPTEEELRAALEEQMRQLRVEDVLLQTIVTLVNLGGPAG